MKDKSFLSLKGYINTLAANSGDQAILAQVRFVRNVQAWDLIDGVVGRLLVTHKNARMTYVAWMQVALQVAQTEANRLAQQIRRQDLRLVSLDDPERTKSKAAAAPTSLEIVQKLEELQRLRDIAARISDRIVRTKPALGTLSNQIAEAIVRWPSERQISLARHLAECTGLDRRRCAELEKIIIRLVLDDLQGGQSVQ